MIDGSQALAAKLSWATLYYRWDQNESGIGFVHGLWRTGGSKMSCVPASQRLTPQRVPWPRRDTFAMSPTTRISRPAAGTADVPPSRMMAPCSMLRPHHTGYVRLFLYYPGVDLPLPSPPSLG